MRPGHCWESGHCDWVELETGIGQNCFRNKTDVFYFPRRMCSWERSSGFILWLDEPRECLRALCALQVWRGVARRWPTPGRTWTWILCGSIESVLDWGQLRPRSGAIPFQIRADSVRASVASWAGGGCCSGGGRWWARPLLQGFMGLLFNTMLFSLISCQKVAHRFDFLPQEKCDLLHAHWGWGWLGGWTALSPVLKR